MWNFEIAAIQDAVKNEGDVTHLGQTNHETLSTTSNVVISTACERIPKAAAKSCSWSTSI